jgi:lipid-A-disaccharide synthase-like uncharacterized protein
LSPLLALLSPVPLAFQVWDAFGWAGQGLFTWRFVEQWLTSEKARRSVVTPSFWWTSLLATALLVVYTLHRKDPVYVAGFLPNLFLYARNLQMSYRPADAPPRGSPLLPVLLGLALFGALTVVSLVQEERFVSYEHPLTWLVVGFTGQALWTSRFLVQWFVSERLGRSVLPASFFWLSLVGAPLLFAWAVHRVDWVMMVAFAMNPIPYARNLVLLYRERRREPAGPEGRPA